MTHACRLNGVCDFDEELLVFGIVLSSHEYLDRDSTAFDLVEVFGCIGVREAHTTKTVARNQPFFWVVRM